MKCISKIMVCALVATAACGDDDDDSGVSQSKTLNAVTAAEAKKLCDWTFDQQSKVSVTAEQSCTVAAALSTEDESACILARNACVEADRSRGPTNAEPDVPCEDVTANDFSCDNATVGEYQDCITALTKQTGEFFRSASCGEAGQLDEPSPPDACRSLNQNCPGILADVSAE